MNKVLKLTLLSILFTLSILYVNAECSNKEIKDLGQEAHYIKAVYDYEDLSTYKTFSTHVKDVTYFIPNYKFSINLYNLSNNFYIKVEESVKKNTFNIYSENYNNGEYVFYNSDFNTIHKYTFSVYANTENCKDKKIRTINLTKPKYNAYSEYPECQNLANQYCQKFITSELSIKNDADFLEKISKKSSESSNMEKKEEYTLFDDVKNNWFLYLSVTILAIIFLIIAITLIKIKEKRRDL